MRSYFIHYVNDVDSSHNQVRINLNQNLLRLMDHRQNSNLSICDLTNTYRCGYNADLLPPANCDPLDMFKVSLTMKGDGFVCLFIAKDSPRLADYLKLAMQADKTVTVSLCRYS